MSRLNSTLPYHLRPGGPEQPTRQVLRCVPDTYQSHRYLLEIQLHPGSPLLPRLTVILKNPSTAGATRSDPTIGKVEAWARRQGFGLVSYVNLFGLRSTRPAALNHYDYDYTVGDQNDYFIALAVEQAHTVVAAWGNSNGIDTARYNRRISEVLALVGVSRLKLVGRRTRLGYPRHGLLWNNNPALADFVPGLACEFVSVRPQGAEYLNSQLKGSGV